jgi:transposase-like protein
MKNPGCPNQKCLLAEKTPYEGIIRHGFYKTTWGKRRRYRCPICGKTFCSTTGTPYHRLQHRRATFDEVASLSVESLSKSAIARVKRIAFHEKARWCQ